MAGVFRRKRGDTLQPSRFTPAVVAALKQKSREFDGQYQQEPVPASGRIFNPNWWRLYKSKELPEMELVALSIDSSFKAKSSSDYVSIQKWGMLGVRSYLMDRRCEHLGYTATKAAIKTMQRDGRAAAVILVEDKANGPAIIEELKADPDFGASVIAIDPQGDKVARANAASTDVEAGSVYLPEDADYLNAFVRTFASFPGVKHDDDVDALSQFINWRRSRNLAYGLLDWAKVSAEKWLDRDPAPRARVDNHAVQVAKAQKQNPVCPRCTTNDNVRPANVLGGFLCRQCGMTLDADGKATAIEIPQTCGCSNPLLTSNGTHCNSCGWNRPRPATEATNGMTFARLRRFRGWMIPGGSNDSLNSRIDNRIQGMLPRGRR